MKLIEYKQFGDFNEERKLNKKKITIASAIASIILLITIIIIAYLCSSNFRNFMDKYILLKNISDTNIPHISIETDENISAYAFHDYVVVLKNNKLNLYNSSGKSVQELNINISSPFFENSGKYLVVAEKGQQKVYLIKDKKIAWENNVEGNISRVTVNENGNVAVIVTGTSYKSVIITFDSSGREIFKTFLSSTLATDAVISGDNKYLSFCELDISGTLVESRVKTISIEEAKTKPENAIIYTYQIPSNMLVTSMEYHQRNDLICMCDSTVCLLKAGAINTIETIDKSHATFAGIGLTKSYFKIIENMHGINNQTSDVEIKSTSSNSTGKYTIKGIAKNVSAKDGVIAVNMGTELYFINENGWLLKKFNASQEIKDVVFSNNIAGIIYRNKIQFINL